MTKKRTIEIKYKKTQQKTSQIVIKQKMNRVETSKI